MARKVALYTSNRGISLQKVTQHIGEVLSRTKEYEVTYVFSPNMDPKIVETHDAGVVVMPFDVVWVLAYFYIAWKYWYKKKRYVFYTTIEGDSLREALKLWIIRDLEYVANSEYTARKIQAVGARVRDIVHHGVDVEAILSAEAKGREMKKTLGLEDKLVVGYIASGHRRKCHDLFSRVVKVTESKKDSVQFVILTDDRGAAHYRDTKALVVSAFSNLTDEEVYSLYHAIDIYAHGACSEGFGLPVAEALAAGRPVVIPDYQPLTEFTPKDLSVRVKIKEHQKHDEGGGIIYDLYRYDPEEMSSKILEAGDMLARRDFSEDSFISFRERYSIAAKYRRIVELLEQ